MGTTRAVMLIAVMLAVPGSALSAQPDFTFKVHVDLKDIDPEVDRFGVSCAVCTTPCRQQWSTSDPGLIGWGNGEAYHFPEDNQRHGYTGVMVVEFSATNGYASSAKYYSCFGMLSSGGRGENIGTHDNTWMQVKPGAPLVGTLSGPLHSTMQAAPPFLRSN